MQPSRRFVDLSFWLCHIGLALGILVFAYSQQIDLITMAPFLIGCLASFAYVFAIGFYVQKFGRHGIIWSGIAFFTAPLGIWGTYIALFVLKDKLMVSRN